MCDESKVTLERKSIVREQKIENLNFYDSFCCVIKFILSVIIFQRNLVFVKNNSKATDNNDNTFV